MNNILLAVGLALWAVGAFFCVYQIYAMVALDARCRGLKHPTFWGLFAAGGNNNSGLLLYLLGRKRFAIESMTPAQQAALAAHKKKTGVGLVFVCLGAIVCIWCILLMP